MKRERQITKVKRRIPEPIPATSVVSNDGHTCATFICALFKNSRQDEANQRRKYAHEQLQYLLSDGHREQTLSVRQRGGKGVVLLAAHQHHPHMNSETFQRNEK